MESEKKKVETYRIDYECDSCKVGNMNPTGISMSCGFKESYEHICDNCGVRDFLPYEYPRIEYKIED